MELQKLSYNVNKKAAVSIKRVVIGFCILVGLTVLGLILSYTIRDNEKQVRLYSAQIDNSMSQKVAFINTIAAGASSGVAESDYYAYVNSMVDQYDDVSAVYVCVLEEGVVYPDGYMTYMSGGWVPDADFVVSDRSWFKDAVSSGSVCVSEPYVDLQSGNICITLSKAIYRDNRVVGVAGLDMYLDDLVSLIQNSYNGGNYVFLVSNQGTILTHPDSKVALSADKTTTLSDDAGEKYKSVCEKTLKTKVIMDYSGGPKAAISNVSESTGWSVVAVISLSWILIVILVIALLAVVLGFGIGRMAQTKLLNGINPMFSPLETLASNVSKISEGELGYNFEVDEQSQEVNALSVALNDTMKSLQNYISEITNTVTAISEKNLDYEVNGSFIGDYERIKDALVDIMQVLNDSFAEINEQAATVLQYSENLSDTSESVAQAATSQSESVQAASGRMNVLTENIEKIILLANSIKENADKTNSRLKVGNDEMNLLVDAMDEISACYDEIAGFVSEINAISAQTNLLALNASIEAARAGESGRGFAVVADEIGILSKNSSVASAKISDAIGRSLQSVENGKELVQKTEKTISDSAEYSEENTKIIGDIVGFVETQKDSAEEISGYLNSISDMVENNAASAEENSAISANLGVCARSLMDMIAQFKLHRK